MNINYLLSGRKVSEQSYGKSMTSFGRSSSEEGKKDFYCRNEKCEQ